MSAKRPPLLETASHSYFQICEKVKIWYGVKDAERWFACERKKLNDRCLDDPLGILYHATLFEFWETKQLKEKYMDADMKSLKQNSQSPADKHNVELYTVRGPGSNGEIGVLTTSHDLDQFINGLAVACAKYLVDSGRGDEEHKLTWIFRNAFPIAFKLAGYKADQVVDRHVFMCGSSAPSADDIVAAG